MEKLEAGFHLAIVAFTFVVFIFILTAVNAQAIIVDGNFSDWFSNVTGFQNVDDYADDVTGEIDNGFTNGIYWAEEDYVHSDTYGWVGPGYGGQSFDHEGLYFTEDINNYYIGLMTGIAPGANYTGWSLTPQYIGDIAIDTGNGFDQSINMQSVRYSGATYSNLLTGVTDWTNTNSYHPLYNLTPYISIGNFYIVIDFKYAQHADSYFYEFGINKYWLDASNGIKLFVTQSCGNDWLEVDTNTTPIPESSTFLMFGIGVVAAAITFRKK